MKSSTLLIKNSKYKIFLGDSISIMNTMEPESIDMIFADPPYNLSNGGTSVQSGKRVSVDKGKWDKSKGVIEDFNFHYSWLEACRRILKQDGTIWISGTYHSIYSCGYALQLLDFRILNDIAWYKPNASPNLGCRMFTASHETLIWASKSKKSKHTFNYKDMREGDFPTNPLKKKENKCGRYGQLQLPPNLRSFLESIQPKNQSLYLIELFLRVPSREI